MRKPIRLRPKAMAWLRPAAVAFRCLGQRWACVATAAMVAAGALGIVCALALIVPAGGRLHAAAPGPVLPDMMDSQTVKAIGRGLDYLARTQRANGSWFNSGGGGTYPTAMTSLAGLSFMAGGSTPETGPHWRSVSRAMNFLVRTANPDGGDGFIGGDMDSSSMHGHGFALLFLAHCYGQELTTESEQRLRKVLDKGVGVTVRSQSDLGKATNHAGGWIYSPSGGGDEGSVTVTQLQALRACRNVGIKVPKATIDRAVAYLKHCQMPDGGICYSASSRGSSTVAISAAGIACFYSAGVYDRARGGAGEEAEMVERLFNFVRSRMNVGSSGGHAFYTQLYLAQAMYQRGGKDWQSYYPQAKRWLLASQSADGSWNGDGIGTTYGTAIACIILQLPYGYLPICER